MRVEALDKERLDDFIEYCKCHRMEVDDSFLDDEDLKAFELNDESPTYIIIDEKDKLAGAASLVIDDYNRRGKKGRFRIFHSEIEDIQRYDMLMKAILKHTDGLDKVYTFVPMANEKLIKTVEMLNFKIYRYSLILVREDLQVSEYDLPKDYEIRPFRTGKDEELWCKVRNAGFAKLKGSETPATPDMIAKMVNEKDHIEGGMMMLYHKEEAIGVVMGTDGDYKGTTMMNIGPLAVIPEYQGKGLGRSLLRAALIFAKEKGYKNTVLCVNAENERAKALYIQEGFLQAEGAVCYDYNLI